MIDNESFADVQKVFARKLQLEGLKALKDLDFSTADADTALRAVEIGIELEKMANATNAEVKDNG